MLNNFLSIKEFFVGVLISLLAALAIASPRWMRLYRAQALKTDEAVDIYLSEQMDAEELTKYLIDKQLLKDQRKFAWAVRTLRWDTFLAGHYQVKKNISYDALLSKLGKGLQDPIRLTVLPGQSLSRFKNSVSSTFQFDSLALQKVLTDSTFLANAAVDSQDIIGRLYPATYEFYWTASPQKVLKRLLDTFEDSIKAKYEARLQKLDKSLSEIITLASIIEWESNLKSEKPVISGLYWNRMEKGMRLQADPTVNYAVGERRRLTYKDYKVKHPYNTYLHSGLPPGPITNPSKSSIKAALFPKNHEYLYMVASPDGGHSFSETYQEHLRKSAEWREWLQKQYRIKRNKQKSKQQ